MQNKPIIDEIWIEYRKTKSPELRNKLVLKYISLVRSILRTINIPPDSILNNQDLINIGILGLVEAIEKFNPEQNVKFETFAYTRIKGSILDELRRVDWLSRSTRKKAKEVLETLDKTFVESGSYDFNSIGRSLGLSDKELKDYLMAYQTSQESFFLSDNFEILGDDEEVSFLENLPATDSKDQLENIVDNEKVQIIYHFLLSLPERERLIMTLHYYENLKFKEIGKIIGLSESRVSQIHSSVIKQLRNKFKQMEE